MDEFSFIQSIIPKSYKQSVLVKGIGDDAAVFRNSTEEIITAVDTFVQDVHFTNKTMTMFHVGYKCLAVNISDLAAMGARPAFYLVSLVVPETASEKELSDIYAGMYEIGQRFQMDLIGGDTVSGKEWVITVTVIGFASRNKVRYRHDAKHNDIVFVTGTLGDAQAGLYILLNGLSVTGQENFIRKHQMPEPRVNFALNCSDISRMALNDISDGLASELNEIAESSDVAIFVDDGKVPVHEHLEHFSQEQQNTWKLFAGEDFELVGTISKQEWPYLLKVAERTGVKLTEIGYVIDDKTINGNVFIQQDKRLKRLERRGYRHKIGGISNEKR